ncbi:MAG: PKD domain-containing protein [Candidatus Bathyarchaeia archaeon]|jgi:hypothetical protein
MRKTKFVTLAIIATLMSAMIVVAVQAQGESPSNPILVPIGGGTYNGTLPNGTNYGCYYNVSGYFNHTISIILTTDDSYWLTMLYGPGSSSALQPPGIGPNNFTYTVTVPGNYCIEVYRNSVAPGNYTLNIAPLNFPPITPSAPSGPSGPWYVYTPYYFTASTTDPEGDNISYTFYWGDGTNNATGLYASGQNVTVAHFWSQPSQYAVSVQATDQYGNSSGYSPTFNLNMSQNDGGNGGDAGNTFTTAYVLNQNSYNGTPFSSTGTLYYNISDGADYYNFTVSAGDWIHVALTPLTNFNCGLILYKPDGSPGYTPIFTSPIDMNATVSGTWTIAILLNDYTYGQYALSLSVNLQVHLTVGVSASPPEGVNITIDGQTYTVFKNSPKTVIVHTGLNNVTADFGFLIPGGGGDYYYVYLFTRWSDGSTANPRSVYLAQDWTVTAIYVRQRGIIL